VKGPHQTVEAAFKQLVAGLHRSGAKLGPELVR
jgi:hypothetical protein